MSRLSLKNDFKDGDILYGEQLNTNNNATMEAVNDNYEKILTLQELKEDVVNVDSKLEGKVDVTAFNDAVNSINSTKADKSEVALKADKSELANKADISYVNNQLTNKADVTYVNTQMNIKADKAALGNLNSLKTNTKTSAVAAINELVDNGSGIKDIDNISITKNTNEDIQAVAVMNRNNTNKAVRTWTGTREEYDALENKDANTLYYITDEPDDYEVKANKTLTINELSTDEQYPSAKAVYDSIQGITPGGSNDYNNLENQPQINGVTLVGNKSSDDLGIKQEYTANDITFTDGETFQQKYDKGELTGPQGETGQAGTDGQDATINGQNAINLIAGTNINIEQEGSDVTISSTSSGGASYTAGTNIEITEDNVINNTIPYNTGQFGTGTNSLSIGADASAPGNECVAIGVGANINSAYSGSVAIGRYSGANRWSTSIGSRSDASPCGVAIGYYQGINSNIGGSISIGANNIPEGYGIDKGSITIGTNAKSMGYNTAVFGSESSPINTMYYISSEGTKTVATTDQTIPAGGTTGQVLMKNSDTDYDFGWASLNNYDEVSF